MKQFLTPFAALVIMLAPPQHASAVEVLSATDLASHCKAFPKDTTSLDGEYCARYIQGFIDGAVTTDARVMLNVEADIESRGGVTERAMRTRAPSQIELQRAARYAEFCLGDPVPLEEVVIKIVNDISQRRDFSPTEAARDLVYASLKKHYPCEPQ